MSENILFFVYNSHQEEYFNFLAQSLGDKYNTYLLKEADLLRRGVTKFGGADYLTKDEIEDLMNFTYLRFKAKFKGKTLLHKVYKKFLHVKAKLCEKILAKFYSEHNIDLVVVWNGTNLAPALAVRLAKEFNIETLYFESGQFPNTLEIDSQGVNAASSLSRKKKYFFVKQVPSKEALAKIHGIEIETRDLRMDRLTNVVKKRQVQKQAEIDLPNDFLFLPFQVYTDTQVLINSPNIDNMYELVDICYGALEKFNQRNNKDYWLVVKEHPSDFGRIDYSDLKKKYEDKNIIFVTDYDVADLIEASQLVITINSSVGIEALLKYKPVITLGKANYNVEGVVNHVSKLNQLPQQIAESIFDEVDYEMIDKFLYYFRYKYLVNGNKEEPNQENNHAVLERIKKELDGEYYEAK